MLFHALVKTMFLYSRFDIFIIDGFYAYHSV
jgi:hypothetical protein